MFARLPLSALGFSDETDADPGSPPLPRGMSCLAVEPYIWENMDGSLFSTPHKGLETLLLEA
jgi:hypothetical protein